MCQCVSRFYIFFLNLIGIPIYWTVYRCDRLFTLCILVLNHITGPINYHSPLLLVAMILLGFISADWARTFPSSPKRTVLGCCVLSCVCPFQCQRERNCKKSNRGLGDAIRSGYIYCVERRYNI